MPPKRPKVHQIQQSDIDLIRNAALKAAQTITTCGEPTQESLDEARALTSAANGWVRFCTNKCQVVAQEGSRKQSTGSSASNEVDETEMRESIKLRQQILQKRTKIQKLVNQISQKRQRVAALLEEEKEHREAFLTKVSNPNMGNFTENEREAERKLKKAKTDLDNCYESATLLAHTSGKTAETLRSSLPRKLGQLRDVMTIPEMDSPLPASSSSSSQFSQPMSQ